jgi:tetratricopeptide (TPR) repeat protein
MKKYLYPLVIIILFTGFGDGDAINNDRGNRLFHKGKYKEAVSMYDKIRNKKNQMISYYNKGNSLINSGNIDDGLEYLKKVTEGSDSIMSSKAYYNMGNTFFNNKKLKEAAQLYINSLRKNPGNSDARYNLEKTLRLLKKQEQEKKNNKDENNKKEKKEKKDDQKGDKKDNKKKNEQSEKQNKMSKKDAEKLLNALMRNRKKIKKDSASVRKMLNPRFTW